MFSKVKRRGMSNDKRIENSAREIARNAHAQAIFYYNKRRKKVKYNNDERIENDPQKESISAGSIIDCQSFDPHLVHAWLHYYDYYYYYCYCMKMWPRPFCSAVDNDHREQDDCPLGVDHSKMRVLMVAVDWNVPNDQTTVLADLSAVLLTVRGNLMSCAPSWKVRTRRRYVAVAELSWVDVPTVNTSMNECYPSVFESHCRVKRCFSFDSVVRFH